MPIGLPSATNLFVPNHAASNSLVVGFSRSPGTFPVSQYCQYISARNPIGIYYTWGSREGARVLNNDDAEDEWPDGAAAPVGVMNLEGITSGAFTCHRKAYAYTMGRITVENATFPILAAEAGVAAQRAMTARTILVQNALSNASWGANTIAIDGGLLPGGQNWKTGSVGFSANQGPNIKVSLQYGALKVHQATIGVVQPRMLSLVINPKTAQAMAASTEVQDYIKQSPVALAQLRGDVPNQNGVWGLPTTLYGHQVIVEDCVRVTSKFGAASDAISYVLADGTAYLLARQGELEGIEGTRTYSTIQVFFYVDELTVFTKFDSDNERYLGRVVSMYVPVVVTTLAGFQFTACLG